jgi:hypothetical protein
VDIMNRIKRSGLVTAVVGVTVVAGFGFAWAQIPDANGTIHACYTKSGGNLRIIDSGQACGSKETSLTWNQAGVQGLKGDPGATGATGAPGPQGIPGIPGAPGPSDVYQAHELAVQFDHRISQSFWDASVSVSVPSGSYSIAATASLNPGNNLLVGCDLHTSTKQSDDTYATEPSSDFNHINVPVLWTTTVTAPTDSVTFECIIPTDNYPGTTQMTLLATKGGTIH